MHPVEILRVKKEKKNGVDEERKRERGMWCKETVKVQKEEEKEEEEGRNPSFTRALEEPR